MKLLEQPISRDELKKIASERFITLVKAVVDVNQEIMVIDADMHADEEALLLKQGSKQNDLWGINLLIENDGVGFIQFDSMINLRPHQGNMTRGVNDVVTQQKIRQVVNKWISE